MRKLKHMSWVSCVVFMPDGKGLVTGGRDKTLKYWDISSLAATRFCGSSPTTHDLKGRVLGADGQTLPEREFSGHTVRSCFYFHATHCFLLSFILQNVVYTLSTTPDGRWLASGSLDQRIRIWDTRNAEVQCALNNDQMVFTVDFSPAAGYLAAGGGGKVTIWKYHTALGDSRAHGG
jgi:WD40 repeat protein